MLATDSEARALEAFETDIRYLEATFKAFHQTTRKRTAWRIRTGARRVVARAQDQCSAAGTVDCPATTPCGTGNCLFAEGVMVALRIPPSPGKVSRPKGVRSEYPTFSEDSLVAAFRSLTPSVA